MSETGSAPAGGRLFVTGILVIAVAVVLLVILFVIRNRRVADALHDLQTEIKAGPHVPVARATRAPTERTVTLTGEARPYATVTLFAKVSGYLHEIRVDKGDRVKTGEILAVIESPELDSQYDAALADARNKRVVAERAKVLIQSDAIARQDADNAEAAALVAEATADGLKAQKEYEVLRAPFSATVTARFADPGTLVQSAIASQTTTQPLVSLSRTDRLRVYIYLDQRNAAFVKVGDRARISDAARPEVKLFAAVSRVSGEIDLKSRTMLVELDLDNRRGKILAGGFVQVSLKLQTPPYVQIPAEALLMRGEKALAGVIGSDNRVRFRPVTPADSDGKSVLLSAGLAEGELVILTPGAGIAEGELVQPVDAGGK